MFLAVQFVFGKEKLFCCCMICVWREKIVSLLYDLSQTLQNFTLSRTGQLISYRLTEIPDRSKLSTIAFT